jgi:20S proteasome alpha/beta subunit
MTLIVGLRCAEGSVLMCADRERSDQIGKRSIDKIFKIRTKQGWFLVSGAGRGSIVDNTLARLDKELKTAGDDPHIVLIEKHRDIIESVLYQIHEEYIWNHRDENNRAVKLLIAASFKVPPSFPFLYTTDEEIVYPQQLYACAGAGEDLAYYFVDKLYNDHLSREVAILLASFVFREVSRSVSGVGLGTDIELLGPKGVDWRRFPPNDAARLEKEIPELAEAIAKAWSEKIKIPDWLIEFCT